MKLFLDTANFKEISEINEWGVLDGVTTNPSLLAKEADRKKDYKQMLKEICAEVDGPVSAEVVSTKKDDMLAEARELAQIAENVYVKFPCIPAGLAATKVARSEGIRVNMTLVFSPAQTLLAAKAGANFISPFLGRIDDVASGGMEILAQCIEVVKNYDFPSEVLASSLRHPMHVVEAARLGSDIGTLPYDVFTKLVKHPLTDIGLERFIADWDKARKELGA
ncbi:MAG TPA: fructose-6-phosphate aldolase [Actinomycetota bacterium]|jgi:transaldolase|nr:fructose-6-phosphate aldolase [Actinomycetota bacterium]